MAARRPAIRNVRRLAMQRENWQRDRRGITPRQTAIVKEVTLTSQKFKLNVSREIQTNASGEADK